MTKSTPGSRMMELARELWPLNRSLTGRGNRETLNLLKSRLKNLEVRSVPSGHVAYDWEVPLEWDVQEAYIVDPSGKRICDFARNNLHLVGYSVAFRGVLSLEELQCYLHSLPSQPAAIPYVTSYYEPRWGFCISHNERVELRPGNYEVVVETSHFQGELNYAELLIPGKSSREVVFSTYICHPSMANNELSGPVLMTELARELTGADAYYSYRFLFIPETIGSLTYLSMNLLQMQTRTLAGYVVTCVGDQRGYSYVPSRNGDSVADKAAIQVMTRLGLNFKIYDWGDRGSDERQFCSPGIDLPFCSVMRSKYGTYPEYHTSLDTLGGVVTEQGLEESLALYVELLQELESKRYPLATQVGEPQLSRRGLYPTISQKTEYGRAAAFVDFLSWSDGKHSLEEIASLCRITADHADEVLETLVNHELVTI